MMLAEWRLESVAGMQFRAGELVVSLLRSLPLVPFSAKRLFQIEMAVVEATGNAIEHAHHFCSDRDVLLHVFFEARAVIVQVHDKGCSGPIPEPMPPNLAAKLAGAETPRGWGLLLIHQLADEVCIHNGTCSHTVALFFTMPDWKRLDS
jgi:anti-sigma regulatory factor (Ser/Thr protein kinase)